MSAINKRRQAAGQSGFTLIELLVVIAILGVLAAVVVFAVGGVNNTSQASACKIEARTVKTAVGAYVAQNSGNNPTAAGDLIPGLLEAAPTLVTITYGASAAVAPTYAWAGACTTTAGLPATP